MFGWLHIAYFTIAVLISFLGLLTFHKKSTTTQRVVAFTVVILLGDALSMFLAFLKIASFKEALLRYSLTTILLLAIVVSELQHDKVRSVCTKVMRWLIVALVVALFIPMQPNQWQSYPFLINQVIWVAVTLAALLDQLKKEDPSPLWRRAYFWFMAGNFCFYCFSFLLFPLRATSVQGIWNSQLHNDMIICGCLFLYGAITLGIVLDKTQPAVPYAQ